MHHLRRRRSRQQKESRSESVGHQHGTKREAQKLKRETNLPPQHDDPSPTLSASPERSGNAQKQVPPEPAPKADAAQATPRVQPAEVERQLIRMHTSGATDTAKLVTKVTANMEIAEMRYIMGVLQNQMEEKLRVRPMSAKAGSPLPSMQ